MLVSGHDWPPSRHVCIQPSSSSFSRLIGPIRWIEEKNVRAGMMPRKILWINLELALRLIDLINRKAGDGRGDKNEQSRRRDSHAER